MLQNLHPPPSAEARHDLETGKTEYIYDEDLDDEFESVLSRLPENCGVLNGAIITSQGCMLLLVLKEHLKVCLKQSFRLTYMEAVVTRNALETRRRSVGRW